MSIDGPTPGRFYDDFVVGEKFVSQGRTLTEADVALYSGLSGDYDPLHTDEEFCKKHSIYGKRIVQGLLGLIVADGLRTRTGLYEQTVIAGLEWKWKFLKPIMIGDTIRVSWTIKDKHATRKSDRGILIESVRLLNQRNEIVAEGEHCRLLRKKSSQ